MATDKMSFKCADCGSDKFEFPHQPPKDSDIIKCAGCGKTIGKYGDVRAAAVKSAKAEVDKMVANVFGKNVKPKWK